MESIFQDSGEVIFEPIQTNFGASHVITSSSLIGSDRWLPVKYMIPHRASTKRAGFKFGKRYIGIYFLNIQNNDFLIINSDLVRSTMTLCVIRREFKSQIISLSDIESFFTDYVNEHSHLLKSKKTIPGIKFVNTSNWSPIPSEIHISQTLESLAHAEIACLLSKTQFIKMPEGCRTDSAFTNDKSDKCIAIQEKSASPQRSENLFQFHKTSGYETMLIVCRPMNYSSTHIGSIVIPGKLVICNTINLSIKSKKWHDFLIPDDFLCQFLLELYHSIETKATTHQWPNGTVVNISGITLSSVDVLTQAQTVQCCKESQAREWRRALLPSCIAIENPKINNSQVDQTINGIRVQDKFARRGSDTNGYICLIAKRGRSVDQKKKKMIPYVYGDFDLLWVFTSENKLFWVIPSSVLHQRGYLTSAGNNGRVSLICYSYDYVAPKAAKFLVNDWTKNYCHQVVDFDFDAITHLLAQSKV